MYLLYSVATLLRARRALAVVLLYQALRHNKYVGSLGQRWAICRCRSTSTPRNRSGFTPCRSARCWRRAADRRICKRAIPAAPVPLDDDAVGQQLAREACRDVDAVFYFPFDLDVHRPPHARPREARVSS